MVSVEERDEMPDPSISSPESDGDSDSNPTRAHRRRLRKVEAVEKHLRKRGA